MVRLWLRVIAVLTAVVAVVSGSAWAQGTQETADSLQTGAVTPMTVSSVPAGRQADRVVVITVEGAIDRVTAMSVGRRVEAAEKAGFDAMVLEVNSPGGELGSVLEISNTIKASSISNTVAWVNPDAYSGGAIIALACGEIVTSSPASFGDAFVINMGPGGIRALSPDERTKFLPPLMADVIDSARRSGYDEYIVQAIVVDGIELWWVEHTETGERLAIGAEEYGYLFDGGPIRGRPMLGQVTGGVQTYRDSAAGDDAEANDGDVVDQDPDAPAADPDRAQGADGADAGDREAGAQDPAGVSPSGVAPADPTAFRPASESLRDVAEALEDRGAGSTEQIIGLQYASQRVLITPADKGNYRLVGYITDGSSAIVMRQDQLRDFGLSSGIINTDEELIAFFGAKEITRVGESPTEKLVRFMVSPVVRFVLIAIFLIAIFVEMITAGTGIAGAVALGALALLLGPGALIGLSGWWELIAILVGLACLAIEAFVIPGFGIFGVVGFVSLFAGLIGTFVSAGGSLSSPAMQKQLMTGSVTVLLAFVTAGIAWWLIVRNMQNLPLFDKLVLSGASGVGGMPQKSMLHAIVMDDGSVKVGSEGVTTTPLYPIGQADFDGQIEDVYAAFGAIERGMRVRVVRATRMRIEVEELVEDAANDAHPEPGDDTTETA
jgi:membrane-bound ClpP family serine protease